MSCRRRGFAQRAGLFHIGRVFGKAHGHIVHTQRHGGADVLHVFVGESRCCESAALFVDAFVVGQLTAQHHLGVHRSALHAGHGQHNQAIVEQQGVARFHVARQLFVVQPYGVIVAQLCASCIQYKGLTRLEHDFALRKLAHPDFGSLQVGHDGYFAACTLRGFAHQVGALLMVGRGAVRKIQPHHIDSRMNHGL